MVFNRDLGSQLLVYTLHLFETRSTSVRHNNSRREIITVFCQECASFAQFEQDITRPTLQECLGDVYLRSFRDQGRAGYAAAA